MELSPAVIKYDGLHENSSSKVLLRRYTLDRTPPHSPRFLVFSYPLLVNVIAKNFTLIQCSLSNLCTISYTVNSTRGCNYKDTVFGFYMALLLTWSCKFDNSFCSCWIPYSQVPLYCFRVCYPGTYCKDAMCTLSPLNIGAEAYKLPFWCSWLGNLPSNTHIWYSYIIFWLPIDMPICYDGIVPAHKMVCQLH